MSWSRHETRSAESGTNEPERAKALLERYRTWRTEPNAILAFLLAGS